MEQERQKIRDRNDQEAGDMLLLLRRGKRGVLNIIFGRTMLIALMLAVQILLLVLAFTSVQTFMPYLYGVQMALYLVLLVHLVNKPSEPTIKVTWILLVVLLPALGVALYVFVEMDIGHRVLNRRLSELIQETAPLMPERAPLSEEAARERPDLEGLARYTWRFGRYGVYENTAVRYCDSGESSMEAMVEDLKQARDFIFMEFFIVEEGYMWGRILKILEEKAREGVEVRVMYDGTCALFRLPYRYPRMLEKLGIQCKMFAPLRPMVSTHYNNRDHRKILVIDGKVAYTGGVNLADEYVNRVERCGHWKDVSLRLEGEAVRGFTLMFLQMWNIDGSGDAFARYLSAGDAAFQGMKTPGYVLPYGDSPLDDERMGEMVYLDILSRARRYVHIMTPYLILDSEMTMALAFAAKRGVEVSIVLPHIPDKKYAFALAKTHYRELIEAGVHILEYTPGFVHAKVFVSDDDRAVVGTINLDYRSLYLHFECAAYLRDVPAIHDIEDDFQATAALCQEIRPEDLKNVKFTTRVAGWLLKVLAPIM